VCMNAHLFMVGVFVLGLPLVRLPTAQLLVNDWNRLPSWLGLVISTNDKGVLTSPLGAMGPLRLEPGSPTNREDVFALLCNHFAATCPGSPPMELARTGTRLLRG
jgi:hypothetical protein